MSCAYELCYVFLDQLFYCICHLIATAIEGNQEGCASQETSIHWVTFIHAHHSSALDNLFTDTTYSIRELIFIPTNSSSPTHMLSFLLPALPTLSVPCKPPYDLRLFSTIFYLILILLLLLWVFLTFSLSSLFPLSSFFFISGVDYHLFSSFSAVDVSYLSAPPSLSLPQTNPPVPWLQNLRVWCNLIPSDPNLAEQLSWPSWLRLLEAADCPTEFRLTTEPNIKTCTELHVLIPLMSTDLHNSASAMNKATKHKLLPSGNLLLGVTAKCLTYDVLPKTKQIQPSLTLVGCISYFPV